MNKNPQDLREGSTPAADWRDWLAVLQRQWLVVAGGVSLGLSAALLMLHLLTPRYDAFLQLVPVERTGATVSRNLSGLASLAGINIRNEPVSQFHLALETMTGRDVAEVVAADTELMTRMFPDHWDAKGRRWRQPGDPLRGLKQQVKWLLALPVRAWSRPDAADAQAYISKRLSMEENKQRGIATLRLRHEDPALARDLLLKVYTAADSHLRMRMDMRTEAYIAYLSRKLQEVSLAEHRQVLSEAMAEQERTLMTARSGQPFASEPLGGVAVTDRPTWPPLPIILAAGLVAGSLLGVLAAFLRGGRRTHR